MKKVLLIIISITFLLVGCGNKNENNSDQKKVSSEIEYFSSQIAILLNNLNNISLDNYELVSEKINLSKSETESKQSNSGESQSEGNGGKSASNSGGNQALNNEGEESVFVTNIKTKNVLNIDTNNVDWNLIKNQIELINSSWSVVMLDLSNANVPNTDILAFGDLLDKTIISIKNENKAEALTNLTGLYSYIPKFLSATSSEKNKQNIENTKYAIFTAYSNVSQNNWTTISKNLSDAENSFLGVLNDTEYSKNKEFKINKTYMLIKDMQTVIPNNDKELFLVKYKTLMESLNTL